MREPIPLVSRKFPCRSPVLVRLQWLQQLLLTVESSAGLHIVISLLFMQRFQFYSFEFRLQFWQLGSKALQEAMQRLEE